MKSSDARCLPLFDELTDYARQRGATDAMMISASVIVVEDRLAEFCNPPGCASYGKGMSCPPHVSGPSGFRSLLCQYEHALVFKIDTFSEDLLSHKGVDIFRQLHKIASGVQQKARLMGFFNAKGFAGGSCKNLFCQEEEWCSVISEGAPCRHPLSASPSMSGFGIDVSKLLESAGWEMKRASLAGDPSTNTPATLAGLVLIA